jgi:hypothetical protein
MRQTLLPPPDGTGVGAGQRLVADEMAPAASVADLAVLRIWSPTRPLVAGEWEMLFCRVTNQGTVAADKRFYTRMWFNNILIRTWYADNLAPDRTAVGSVWVRVEDPGRHQVKVQVDVTNSVPEDEKSNNIRTETADWADAEAMLIPGQMQPLLRAGDEGAPAEMASDGDGANGRARELWTQALAIFEEIGDPRSDEVRTWLAELDR